MAHIFCLLGSLLRTAPTLGSISLCVLLLLPYNGLAVIGGVQVDNEVTLVHIGRIHNFLQKQEVVISHPGNVGINGSPSTPKHNRSLHAIRRTGQIGHLALVSSLHKLGKHRLILLIDKIENSLRYCPPVLSLNGLTHKSDTGRSLIGHIAIQLNTLAGICIADIGTGSPNIQSFSNILHFRSILLLTTVDCFGHRSACRLYGFVKAVHRLLQTNDFLHLTDTRLGNGLPNLLKHNNDSAFQKFLLRLSSGIHYCHKFFRYTQILKNF